MNIKYYTQGKKELAKLYIRVYHSSFDVACFTGIFCQLTDWNNSEQQLLNNPEMNIAISDLKTSILKQFNKAFTSGDVIDKNWLETSVKAFFNRPKDEENLKNENHSIYLTDFANWWIDNHSEKWKTGPRKFMSKKLKSQYQKCAADLDVYEKEKMIRLQLKEINPEAIDEIVVWLEDNNYQPSTIHRFVTRIKFFCARAVQFGYSVNLRYNENVFINKEEEPIVVPILTIDEIEKIYTLDLSSDENLDNIRDLFVCQLFCGLRISDMMTNLNVENIKDGFISLKTQKTNAWVTIPVHDYFEATLKKRFGQLPRKVSENEYNREIKTICQLAEIDQQMYGKKYDADKNRKVKGYYKKHELITSHTSRRSLLTMLKDKVSDQAIKSLFGWAKDSNMINLYNKKSHKDYAMELKQIWDNN